MRNIPVRAGTCGLLLYVLGVCAEAAPPAPAATPPQTGPVLVTTTPVELPDYALITLLTEGPISWFERDDNAAVQARAYRVVITTEEIYNSVYLETVSFGGEGCCKKLARVMKFDLEAFADTYAFVGEKSGFQFVQWLSDSAFIFQYKEREFVMSRLERDDVLVTPYAEH